MLGRAGRTHRIGIAPAGRVAGDDDVSDRAGGGGIDGGGVTQGVGARQCAGRQCADQRAAAGEGTCVGDRTEGQAGSQRVEQGQHLGGGRVRHRHRHRVGQGVARRGGAAGGGVGRFRHGDRGRRDLVFGRAGDAHRIGVVAAGGVAGDDDIADRASGIRIDGGRVAQGVATRQRACRQRAGQRAGAGEGAHVGHRTEGQAHAQRVDQGQHLGGGRVGHGDPQRVGQRVARRHGGAGHRVGGLRHRDRGRHDLVFGRAGDAHRIGVVAAGGVAGDDDIADRASGIRIDGGRVAQGVATRQRACRQRAGQRAGAGEGAHVGHRTEGQAHAQRVDQGQHLGGGRVGHGDPQRVGQRVARRHGGAGHRVGGLRHRDRGRHDLVFGRAGDAHRIGVVAAGGVAGDDDIADRAGGIRIDGGGVAQGVATRQRACRQRAGQRAGAGEGARVGHRTEGQAHAQRVDQGQHFGGGRTGDRDRQRVGQCVAGRHDAARDGIGRFRHGDRGRHDLVLGRARRAHRIGVVAARGVAGGHHIGERAGGVRVDDRRVAQGVGTRQRACRQRAGQRAGAGEGAGVGHRAERQAVAQRVEQRQHLGGGRVRHRRRHRVGQGVAGCDGAARRRVGRLRHRDRGRYDLVLGRAGGADRVGIAAARGVAGDDDIAQRAGGIRIDGGRVGHGIDAWRRARRQAAGQRAGAGEGARVGHLAEAQTHARGVDQGQRLGGGGIGDRDRHRVGQRVTGRNRAARGPVRALGDLDHRDQGMLDGAGDAGRRRRARVGGVAAAGRHHGIGDRRLRVGLHRRDVDDAVAPRRDAGRQGEAAHVAAAAHHEAARIHHRGEAQAGSQGVGQDHLRLRGGVGHVHAQGVRDGLPGRDRGTGLRVGALGHHDRRRQRRGLGAVVAGRSAVDGAVGERHRVGDAGRIGGQRIVDAHHEVQRRGGADRDVDRARVEAGPTAAGEIIARHHVRRIDRYGLGHVAGEEGGDGTAGVLHGDGVAQRIARGDGGAVDVGRAVDLGQRLAHRQFGIVDGGERARRQVARASGPRGRRLAQVAGRRVVGVVPARCGVVGDVEAVVVAEGRTGPLDGRRLSAEQRPGLADRARVARRGEIDAVEVLSRRQPAEAGGVEGDVAGAGIGRREVVLQGADVLRRVTEAGRVRGHPVDGGRTAAGDQIADAVAVHAGARQVARRQRCRQRLVPAAVGVVVGPEHRAGAGVKQQAVVDRVDHQRVDVACQRRQQQFRHQRVAAGTGLVAPDLHAVDDAVDRVRRGATARRGAETEPRRHRYGHAVDVVVRHDVGRAGGRGHGRGVGQSDGLGEGGASQPGGRHEQRCGQPGEERARATKSNLEHLLPLDDARVRPGAGRPRFFAHAGAAGRRSDAHLPTVTKDVPPGSNTAPRHPSGVQTMSKRAHSNAANL